MKNFQQTPKRKRLQFVDTKQAMQSRNSVPQHIATRNKKLVGEATYQREIAEEFKRYGAWMGERLA